MIGAISKAYFGDIPVPLTQYRTAGKNERTSSQSDKKLTLLKPMGSDGYL